MLMRTILLWLGVLVAPFIYAQIPAYYNDVNLTLTGNDLRDELSQKITTTHTTILDYSDVWNALKQSDLDPNNSNKVLLIYGYNDLDGDITNDRTRDKNQNGGDVGEWNREHVYPKSLGQPNLGESGPGADAHHLRSSDVQMNGSRGSRKFSDGNGTAGNVGSNWYPGDEWKGDVARMMMYMYLRYGNQCLPKNVGVGSLVATDNNMINLFLEWNAEDTVNIYETNRNNVLEVEQGNRNPFIDNPYLATIIWGGQVAQDKWDMTTSVRDFTFESSVTLFPNPAKENFQIITDEKSLSGVEIYNLLGDKIKQVKYSNSSISTEEFKSGVYLVKLIFEDRDEIKKLIIE